MNKLMETVAGYYLEKMKHIGHYKTAKPSKLWAIGAIY